jgi:hypothetical protein
VLRDKLSVEGDRRLIAQSLAKLRQLAVRGDVVVLHSESLSETQPARDTNQTARRPVSGTF